MPSRDRILRVPSNPNRIVESLGSAAVIRERQEPLSNAAGISGPTLPTADLLIRQETVDGSEVTLVGGGGADANDVTEWTGLQVWTPDAASESPSYNATGGPDGGPCLEFGDEARQGNGRLTFGTDIRAGLGPSTIVAVWMQPALVSSAHPICDFNANHQFNPYRSGNIQARNNGSYYTIASASFGSWFTTTVTVNGTVVRGYNGRTQAFEELAAGANENFQQPAALGGTRTGTQTFPGRCVFFAAWGADMTSQLSDIWDYIAANWPSAGV